MPRRRYRITNDDVDIAHRWVRERFRKEAWSDDWPLLTAWDRFPLERPTAEELQRWCDRFLDADQWKQLQAVIRAGRRDFSQHRTVRLSRSAHEMLSKLAKRDKITLSEVIERYLSSVADAPMAQAAQIAEPSAPKLMDAGETTKPKVMKVELWLCVERNSKYVRGKKKTREEIERWVLDRYQMEKLGKGGFEYVLSIPYQTDEELDRIIYDDILREAENIADDRYCFIEAEVRSVEDPERYW